MAYFENSKQQIYGCIYASILHAFYIDSSQQKFGKGTGPILMDFVNCTGSEPRLWPTYSALGCPYLTHYYGCSHNDDAGVKCQPGITLLRSSL